MLQSLSPIPVPQRPPPAPRLCVSRVVGVCAQPGAKRNSTTTTILHIGGFFMPKCSIKNSCSSAALLSYGPLLNSFVLVRLPLLVLLLRLWDDAHARARKQVEALVHERADSLPRALQGWRATRGGASRCTRSRMEGRLANPSPPYNVVEYPIIGHAVTRSSAPTFGLRLGLGTVGCGGARGRAPDTLGWPYGPRGRTMRSASMDIGEAITVAITNGRLQVSARTKSSTKEPDSAVAHATALLTSTLSNNDLLSQRDSARETSNDGTIGDVIGLLNNSRLGSRTPRRVEEQQAGQCSVHIVRCRQGRAADPRVALGITSRRSRAAWEPLRPSRFVGCSKCIDDAGEQGGHHGPCPCIDARPECTTSVAAPPRMSPPAHRLPVVAHVTVGRVTAGPRPSGAEPPPPPSVLWPEPPRPEPHRYHSVVTASPLAHAAVVRTPRTLQA